MQTDILIKQVQTSLNDLKTAIDKFEKHPSPSIQYTEKLYATLCESNKLVSAYLVLKEQKEVSPELNMHLNLMSVSLPEKTIPTTETIIDENPITNIVTSYAIENIITTEKIQVPEIEEPLIIEKQPEIIIEKIIEPITVVNAIEKEWPKIVINLNDKFRFINELFAANVNEYNIAIEQINAVTSLIDLDNYLKGLKSIYNWNDDNDVVKNLYTLSKKRFA
jgi:hypothetical protein